VVTEVTSRPAAVGTQTLEDRRRTADRIFRGALIFNTLLTVFWLVVMTTGGDAFFFQDYRITSDRSSAE
jgi:hypothetical protein